MKEAIFILEREQYFLEQCLKGWKKEHYPEAFIQRNKKLKEIKKAIETIKQKQALIQITGK
jgi:hypothetical protein